MRGKRPKERKSYVLRMRDGNLVKVTREVYLEWYQSRRRERYQRERDQKHGVSCINESDEKRDMYIFRTETLEETVLKKLYVEKLWKVINGSPEADIHLLYLLYFDEITVRETAKICGCSNSTVANRRNRILKELNKKMKDSEFM